MLHQDFTTNNFPPLSSDSPSLHISSSSDATPDVPDYTLPFYKYIKNVQNPITKRKIKIGSHAYWVLYALYRGDIIDDYENKPMDLGTERKINNISQRVFDLKNKYGIKEIESRKKDDGKVVEFFLKR